MNISASGVKFIKSWEGLSLKAYQCQAGVWTLGWGSTFHKDKSKVQKGETITEEEADDLLMFEIGLIEKEINKMNLNLNQHQYDSVISFCFNVGVNGFKKSTLLKLIKQDPFHPSIRDQFLKWNKVRVDGKLIVSKGLSNRRNAEVNIYFG